MKKTSLKKPLKAIQNNHMKKLIENWNKHLNELVGEEEGEEEAQTQTDIRTMDGKKSLRLSGRFESTHQSLMLSGVLM